MMEPDDRGAGVIVLLLGVLFGAGGVLFYVVMLGGLHRAIACN